MPKNAACVGNEGDGGVPSQAGTQRRGADAAATATHTYATTGAEDQDKEGPPSLTNAGRPEADLASIAMKTQAAACTWIKEDGKDT